MIEGTGLAATRVKLKCAEDVIVTVSEGINRLSNNINACMYMYICIGGRIYTYTCTVLHVYSIYFYIYYTTLHPNTYFVHTCKCIWHWGKLSVHICTCTPPRVHVHVHVCCHKVSLIRIQTHPHVWCDLELKIFTTN